MQNSYNKQDPQTELLGERMKKQYNLEMRGGQEYIVEKSHKVV